MFTPNSLEVFEDKTAAATPFETMDSMYRYQRYIYDATRKFYLLGRDKLIDEMNILAGERVAELGCGTGRNLAILAKKYPRTNFFGLDASNEMLTTAQTKINAANLGNVVLQTALADNFCYQKTFGLEKPFDTIFFSYSISMIPTWRESIECALANLRPGGRLYIVDFYDQRDLPGWFRGILKSWLKQFHVQFWYDLLPHLEDFEKQGLGKLEIVTVAHRYAFIAKFQTNSI